MRYFADVVNLFYVVLIVDKEYILMISAQASFTIWVYLTFSCFAKLVCILLFCHVGSIRFLLFVSMWMEVFCLTYLKI
jgi:hypothetical protein